MGIGSTGLISYKTKESSHHLQKHTLNAPLRLDLLVNDLVIVECKSTTQYNSIFEVQTLTYLRLLI